MQEPHPDLESCVIALDGDVIVQIFDEDSTALLTLRNPQAEQQAAVRLTKAQAEVLAGILQMVKEPGLDFC